MVLHFFDSLSHFATVAYIGDSAKNVEVLYTDYCVYHVLMDFDNRN